MARIDIEMNVKGNAIDSLEKIAVENKLSEVASVTLEIGEVSGVVDSYLKDCWKWAVNKHEFIKGAELITEEIPAVSFCEDCQKSYGTVEYGRTCPYCSGEKTYLLTGNEFNIKEIEAC